MHFWIVNAVFLILQSLFGFIWTPVTALVFLLLFMIWLPLTLRGWKTGLKAAAVTGLLVCFGMLVTALFRRQPKLIFLALGNAFAWYLFSVWYLKQIQRSFVGTGREWFQGAPKEIPGLICEVPELGTFKTSRFDKEGAVIILGDPSLKNVLKKTDPKTLYFQFQNVTMTCSGKWSKINLDAMGLGIQFSGMDPDREKELGDFFEKIKGAGHEAAGI